METGVGGGVSPTGDKKATTAEEAAYTVGRGGQQDWAGQEVGACSAGRLADATQPARAHGRHACARPPRCRPPGGCPLTSRPSPCPAFPAPRQPFFGMAGPYSRANDPFILYDLAQPSPVRDYARRFYTNVRLAVCLPCPAWLPACLLRPAAPAPA